MHNNNTAFIATRRQFMKMGAGGAMLLGGLSLISQVTGCSSPASTPASGYAHLRPQDLELLQPLMLSGMGGVVTEQDADQALQYLDQLLDSGTPGGREFIFLLYDVLQLSAFRWFVLGTGSHPKDMNPAQLDAALAHWGSHTNNFARITLSGLLQPMQIAWYSHSHIGKRIGYPGPPLKVIAP